MPRHIFAVGAESPVIMEEETHHRMKNYDVIIVGAGPAGLRCAELLVPSGLSVLLVEKDLVPGEKVCAGGLTRKDMAILDIPDRIIEHKISRTALHTPRKKSSTDSPVPFLFTIDRKELARWQMEKLEKTTVVFMTGARVTSVEEDHLVVNGNEKYGYTYLVGADGYSSVVRRFLGIPQERKLIGLQYQVPVSPVDPVLEIYLDSEHFGAWYAWSFPHRHAIAVGCTCDPNLISTRLLKDKFHRWLRDKGIDISAARYESGPISYDYRGLRFGNVFLVGEAGGFASGLTGEGIYQSLVSGEAAALMILDPSYEHPALKEVLRYNRIQEKIMRFLHYAGPFREMIHGILVGLMNNKHFKARLNSSFS